MIFGVTPLIVFILKKMIEWLIDSPVSGHLDNLLLDKRKSIVAFNVKVLVISSNDCFDKKLLQLSS